MQKIKDIAIGKRIIGSEQPPLFLPDIGTFFNKNINEGKSLIKVLLKNKVEIIKGEILHNPEICLDDKNTYDIYYSKSKKKLVKEKYKNLINKKVCSLSDYEKLFSICKKNNLPFVLSVYDFTGASFAKDIGAVALKIASSNIVHLPLIEFVSKMNLPMIIDTGASNFNEIKVAYMHAYKNNAKKIILQHSPPPPRDSNFLNLSKNQNLSTMLKFRDYFKCHVGLSDHYPGPEMLYLASSMGVSLIEKGVCMNNNVDGQDVSHAMNASDYYLYDKTCKVIRNGIGLKKNKLIRKPKVERMGLVAKNDLLPGDTLSKNNIYFAWPAKGIKVEKYYKYINYKVKKFIKKDMPIYGKHLQK